MAQTISIALNVADKDLARQLTSHLAGAGGVRIVGNSTNGSLPPGPAEIVIIEDMSPQANVLEKIQKLRGHLPGASIFVLSGHRDPDHIVEVMRAGAAEYFLIPTNPEKLEAAVDRVRALLSGPILSKRGAVYSFVSSKGGLGATVVAVNTAVALTSRSKGVALLDNTLESGDSSVLLDLVPERTVADVSRHFHRLDHAFLQGSMLSHNTGIHFLPAPSKPEESGGIQPEHVGRILDLARGVYEHTVVDCRSMSVDPCSVEAFKASDRIFIVSDLSVTAVRNAARLIQLLQKLRINDQKVEVVVNRFIKGSVPPVSEVEKTLERRVFWLFPNEFTGVVNSINQGVPLVKSRPGSLFSKSMGEFVERCMRPAAEDAYRGVKGFLGRAL